MEDSGANEVIKASLQRVSALTAVQLSACGSGMLLGDVLPVPIVAAMVVFVLLALWQTLSRRVPNKPAICAAWVFVATHAVSGLSALMFAMYLLFALNTEGYSIGRAIFWWLCPVLVYLEFAVPRRTRAADAL
jgi:hypothetical protein